MLVVFSEEQVTENDGVRGHVECGVQSKFTSCTVFAQAPHIQHLIDSIGSS